MRTFMKTSALAVAATLALTACSSDDGGGNGVDVGADAAPAEVVAAGIANRTTDGMSFKVTLEGDIEALEAAADEPAPPEVLGLFEDGFLSGALSPEGGFAMDLGQFLQFKVIEEALYLRIDLGELAAYSPDAAAELPSAAELQGMVAAFGLPPALADLANAALSGDWIGVTGLSEEAIESFSQNFGIEMPTSDDASEQEERVRAIMDDLGLLDGTAFVETYLEVSGDGPTYDVTVQARKLAETLVELAGDLEDLTGGAAGDVPDPADVPETLSGIQITVEDGRVTRITFDVAAVGESAGEDTGDMEPGDLLVHIDLGEISDELDAPDATTIDFSELQNAIMGAFLGAA